MSHRKRKLEDFDPNKSDSADSDFDIRAQTQSTPRSRKNKLSKPFKNRSRPAPKRRRETYADSEDDIVDDDEEIDESERSFQEDSASEEEAEVNPRTGRKQRRATKKEVKYEEPSEDDIEEPSDSDEPQISPKKIQRGQRSQRTQRVESVQPKQTLIVKLHVPSLYRTHPIVHPTTEEMHNTRTTRSRTGSKTTATRPTPERLLGQRRSSRLSHNDEEPLIALTDSGRHAQVTRPGTATPEPPSSRPTRSNKGLKQLPSTVFEDSQEVSREDLGAGPEDIISQLQQHASQLGALTEAGASDRGSPITYETQADTDVDAPGEDIQMDEAAAEEAENADDDDDDDEGPIKRRGSRTLRVSTFFAIRLTINANGSSSLALNRAVRKSHCEDPCDRASLVVNRAVTLSQRPKGNLEMRISQATTSLRIRSSAPRGVITTPAVAQVAAVQGGWQARGHATPNTPMRSWIRMRSQTRQRSWTKTADATSGQEEVEEMRVSRSSLTYALAAKDRIIAFSAQNYSCKTRKRMLLFQVRRNNAAKLQVLTRASSQL